MDLKVPFGHQPPPKVCHIYLIVNLVSELLQLEADYDSLVWEDFETRSLRKVIRQGPRAEEGTKTAKILVGTDPAPNHTQSEFSQF